MKLYIVGQAPTNFYEEVQDLGFTLLNGTVSNVSKGLIDADIILGIVSSSSSPIIHTHLGVAIGDKLSKKDKKIMIVLDQQSPAEIAKEVHQLYTQPYILLPSTLKDAFESYLTPLAPKPTSRPRGPTSLPDEEFKKNNLYMIRALAATLYSQMSPEHGEPLSLQLTKKDIDKIVEDIAIKAEILEPSKDIALYFTSKLKPEVPTELQVEEE